MFFKFNKSFIRFYPPAIRQRLAVIAADAYIADGQEEKAVAVYDVLSRDNILGPVSAEAERLAASVLIEALALGDVVPPGTLRLVCSAVLRHARSAYGVRLAEKLADLDDNLEVLILGQMLLDDVTTRAAGLALLRRLG